VADDHPQLQPRQRVAAYGLARRGGAVLLARASAQSALPGSWFLPGGGVEFGEAPAACVAREFLEETGLTAHVSQLLDVVSDVTDLPSRGERLHAVRILYAVDVDGRHPVAESDGTTDRVAWVLMTEALALPLMPFVRALLLERQAPLIEQPRTPAAVAPHD